MEKGRVVEKTFDFRKRIYFVLYTFEIQQYAQLRLVIFSHLVIFEHWREVSRQEAVDVRHMFIRWVF